MLKLGFITAVREDSTLWGESFYKRIMPNLGPMYLAGFVEKKRLPVEIQIRDHLEDFAGFKPNVLGISTLTENFEFAKQLARQAKELWNCVVILGGVHITALPESMTQDFDYGVIGEGEETLCDLLGAILEGDQSLERMKKIPGIVFHSNEGLCKTDYRKGIPSLDEIPFPARERYLKSGGITYMMTSRGCPYTCSFCTIPYTSEGYRVHSPQYVVDEIRSIKRHYPEVKHIRIFDDLYIVNRKRVMEIAELVAAEGLNQELSFSCWGRANLIDEALIASFKKMNMTYVAFGAESGSSRVLSQIKPGSSVERNQAAIDQLHDHGVGVACSVILGHPLETEDDLWATYEFIEKNLPKIFEVEFNVAIPWPGTDLWQIALKNGMVHPQMDFSVLKETAIFPNYCTDYYPYMNEKIAPERFDLIMADFKKLYWNLFKRNKDVVRPEHYAAKNDIARLF